MPDFGWGIIGCGVIAPWHAEAVGHCPDVELVAVADIIPERAQALADKHGAKFWCRDYQELLQSQHVDFVSICTPSGMHADMGIAAAQAGRHALIEKPIDIALGKIDALIAAQKQHGTKIGCIFQSRTYDTSKLVRETVQAGKLGKMVLGDVHIKWYRSQDYYDSGDWRGTWALDGGGCLMNQGVHGIDLLLWIMGPIKTIQARADHLLRNIEVEDTALAIVEYANGAFGVIEGATTVWKGLPVRHELHGEVGTIVMHDARIVKWDVKDLEPPELATEKAEGAGAADPAAIPVGGHIFQVQDMVNAVRENRDPYIPVPEARKAVEVILGIYESSRTGRAVSLPLQP